MIRRTKIALVVIFLAALILRFWHLTSLPYSPDGDEVAFGYYGWSILHFGTDEFGKILPSSFSSIGDFKYPSLAYLNTVPAAIFGLNDLTTRFLSALSGATLVLLVFYLADLLFANSFISLASALFVAISPWGIIESRLGYESMISTTLTTAAIFFLLKLLKGWKSKHTRLIWASMFLLFLVATFTYAAPRIFIPLILLVLLGLMAQKRKIATLLVCITLIIVISLISPANRGRAGEDIWKGISAIESDRLEQLYIGAGISTIKIPARLTWFFHNKYELTVFDFLQRYSEHFNLDFLFFNGEASLQRVPDMGVLLFVDILFLPFGFLYILKRDKNQSGKLVLAWLFISPVASALTVGGAVMNRASMMIVPLSILSSYGFYSAYRFTYPKYRNAIFGIMIFGIAASCLYSLNQIFIQKPYDRPWYKQTVNESLTKEILRLKDSYKAVVTPDDDYIFFLFYGKISPKDFLKNADIEPATSVTWERVNRLGNIYFKMPFKCPKSGKLNVLYVCAGGDVPQNSKIIETFYYPDGVPAYSLIEFYPLSQMLSPLPVLSKDLHYMVDVEKTPQFNDGIIPANFPSFW